MRFGEKLIIYIFRPIYRTFFERLLWWFLTRIKIFFFTETSVQLSQVLRKLENIEASQEQQRQRWAEVEDRLRAAEANNTAQWDGLEQLLLAMFCQAESRNSDIERKDIPPEERQLSPAADVNRVHAASSIR